MTTSRIKPQEKKGPKVRKQEAASPFNALMCTEDNEFFIAVAGQRIIYHGVGVMRRWSLRRISDFVVIR
jgi:hypothetical protein